MDLTPDPGNQLPKVPSAKEFLELEKLQAEIDKLKAAGSLETEKLKAEIIKVKAEGEKAHVEVNRLRHRGWQSVTVLGTVLPAVIVLVGAWFSYKTGFFSANDQRLKNERFLLQIDIEKFTPMRDGLSNQVNQLRLEVGQLKRDGAALTNRIEELSQDVVSQMQWLDQYKCLTEEIGATNALFLLAEHEIARLKEERNGLSRFLALAASRPPAMDQFLAILTLDTNPQQRELILPILRPILAPPPTGLRVSPSP